MFIFLRTIRRFASDPVTDWATAILQFLSGLVAVLVLVGQLPFVTPEVAAWLVGIVTVLNTIIALLRRLIPAPAS